MKTISKRFLKGALAMLLAVVMLFGTTITGFAAVVDNADTSANVDLVDTSYDISSGKTVYYIDTASWGACQMYIWKDSDGYNTYYTLSKIANTKIYQYNFSGGWGGYSGFKFRSNTSWSKQSAGDIKTNISNHTWFNGTSTTSHTNMDGLNGEAKVVTMISTDGGSTYTATADPNVYTTVSGYNVANGASSTTKVSSSTTASSSASIEAAYGSTITYTANATGATFKGLSSTNSSTLPSSFVSTSSTYTKTATGYNTTNNTTYYAYYVLDTAETYTVTYNAGNGSNPPASQTKTEGENLTLSTDEPTAPTGYYFVGWNTQADGQGDTYLPGGTYAVDEDVILYAQYAKSSVTYTFKDFNGTVLKTGTVDSGTDVSNLAPTPTAREGYEHSGWTPTLGAITSNTEFSPNYTPINYTITLNANGGTVAGGNTITYTINDAITLPTPTYGNNKFDGWEDANGNEVTTVPAGSTGDKSYTAQWTMTYAATAHNYVNKVNDANGTFGGTVTVNDSASPVYVASGESVTFKATPNTNYYFAGWYSDVEFTNQVSADATYTTTMTETGVTLYALFIKNFYLREYTSKENAVTFKYDVATDSYSSDDNAFVEKFTVISDDGKYINDSNVKLTTDTCVGISSITGHYTSYYILTADTVNYDTTKPVTYTLTPNTTAGTYKLNIALTEAEKFDVTFDGTTTAHAANSTVTLTVDCPAGQYLSSASVTPDLPMEFNINGDTISFTMPEQDITVTPVFANYSYVNITDTTGITATGLKTGYKAGEAVEITLSPASAATTITNVVADNNIAVITQNGDNWTVSIASMPADTTITLTPTVDAKFVMNYGTAAIGNYGTGVTSGFGTVTMKIGDTTLAQGGYAGPTDTVTYTASESNANYTFVGFYSDAACKNLLTYNTTYEVKPTKDTTVYTLWARRQWIDFDRGATNIIKELEYDKERGAYILETTLASDSSTNAISKTAWFLVTNDQNDWEGATASYHHFDDSFAVSFNAYGYGATVRWPDGENNANSCWILSSDAADGTPATLILTPTGNTAIDFSVSLERTGTAVYISSGHNDLGHATTTITTAGITATDKVAKHSDETVIENYKYINLSDAQTISWETTIGGDHPEYVTIDSYVVYKIQTGAWEIIKPNELGNNVYSGSTYVDGDCYILPVFFNTEAYGTATGKVPVEVYFDISDVSNTYDWGPFVACYAYSAAQAEYQGTWPGQMMIPTADGKSFYSEIYVDPATAKDPASGILFSNYLEFSCPVAESGVFGTGATKWQTYDYREAITLYEQGYEVITFVAKDSTDGYHGSQDYANIDIFSGYDFEYLVSRNGVPMDLCGNEIEEYVDITTNRADYYIISEGNVNYVAGDYDQDLNYNGEWSVKWHVFDSNGNYKGSDLSTSFYFDENTSDGVYQTVLMDILGVTSSEVAGKTVAISYEAENGSRIDGQWYGSMLDHSVTAQVKVGFTTDNGKTFTINPDTEKPNIANYGQAYVIDPADGEKKQTADIKIEYGIADLTAVEEAGYVFIGWYTQMSDGTYKSISTAVNHSPYINMNETYYAMFREVASGEVVINHSTYINNDPAIPSHGGVAEMSIEVYKNGTLVTKATPSTSRTSVSFPGVEDEGVYTIKIITTPLMNGEFFAWYTDSSNADGTKTYEEVFTDETHISSTETVEATFDYEYTQDSQKIINIYSDVRRVTNKANLYYKYYNRAGVLRTYTVKDLTLTDDECMGYEGNGEKPYCPTFLTELTFTKNDSKEVVYVKAENETATIDEYEAAGWELEGSYNKISAYAPKEEVTEVFNGTVEWKVIDTQLTTEKSEITLFATQGDPIYEINYTAADVTGIIPGKYNTLATYTAPATNADGKAFSYWQEKDPVTEEWVFLTYNRRYSYRIVENKEIRAVYGADNLQDWVPSIDSVTYTREYSDAGDYIYTDFLLAYNSKEGKTLNEVKTAENIKYGLMMVMDPTKPYSGTGDVEYLTPSVENLETAAKYGKNKLIGTTRYYNFDLTNLELTNFNRCDYFKRYDNNDATNNFKCVAYTCYAYLIVGETVYLSNPEYVNFYRLAMMDPDKFTDN